MGALTRPLKALQGGGLLVALLVASTSVLAGEKDIPGHPVIESVENCKAYKEDVYQALHAQFQRELSCISSTSADISYGAECNDLTGQVSTGLHAWPHCQDAEYHCALVRASADADQCLEQSRAQSSRSSGTDKVLSDIIEADALVGEINAYPAFVTDPEGYIREKSQTNSARRTNASLSIPYSTPMAGSILMASRRRTSSMTGASRR